MAHNIPLDQQQETQEVGEGCLEVGPRMSFYPQLVAAAEDGLGWRCKIPSYLHMDDLLSIDLIVEDEYRR